MAERTNAQLLKSCEVQASVGSNPTPSAQSSRRGSLTAMTADMMTVSLSQ